MEQLCLLEQSRLEDPGVDDRVHVQRVAEAVVSDLDARPPVDLEMVASYQGVSSVDVVPLNCSGCLVTDPRTGAISIRLRSADSIRRRRFTGFHEIVHTFMPGFRLTTQWRCEPADVAARSRDLEALCDLGAAELLLPRRLVQRDLVDLDFGLAAVDAVADRYEASLHASAARVAELWPDPTLLVVLERCTKPSEAGFPDAEPRLRVIYSRRRGDWPYIKRHKSVDTGDPLQRALEGELVDELAVLRGISSSTVEDLELSARLVPYTDPKGRIHERVFALYRRAKHRTR